MSEFQPSPFREIRRKFKEILGTPDERRAMLSQRIAVESVLALVSADIQA